MSPDQKAFMKILDELVRTEGLRQFEALSAFLELTARAFRGKTVLLEAWDKNEAEYLAKVGTFRHPKETTEACARALALLITALDAEPTDFLGPIFMECAANPHSGQFFTPWSLCQIMADMQIGEDVAEITKTRIVTIQEPACGCGAMVIAAAERLKKLGVCPARRAHCVLVDVDIRCVWASYIQCSLLGISATVIHGNTLSLETWSAWQTPTAIWFPKRLRDSETAAETTAMAPPPPPTSPEPTPATAKRGQLQLSFDDF